MLNNSFMVDFEAIFRRRQPEVNIGTVIFTRAKARKASKSVP